MAHKREKKDESELKLPKSLTICSPPITTQISTSTAPSDSSDPDPKTPRSVNRSFKSAKSKEKPDLKPTKSTAAASSVIRCSGCRKKVGLMGFRCRCGELFCSEHRYSDRHECSFDYKAAGREAIARENPMVRAAKILKV